MTFVFHAVAIVDSISTHTLTWSVTCILSELCGGRHNFNSHAHVERDDIISKPPNTSQISTHTLTWSVTGLLRAHAWTLRFQLTRSRGAWLFISVTEKRPCRFQLTRSRGAWLLVQLCHNCRWGNFNSHAHVERDVKCCGCVGRQCNFNSHAHVERDLNMWFDYPVHRISTHTLTWSVT